VKRVWMLIVCWCLHNINADHSKHPGVLRSNNMLFLSMRTFAIKTRTGKDTTTEMSK